MGDSEREELVGKDAAFDALHGTDLANPTSPVFLYPSREAVKRIENKETMGLLLLCAILTAVFCGQQGLYPEDFRPFMGALLISLPIGVLGQNIYRRWRFSRNAKPVLEIYPKGLVINYRTANYDFIPWHYIKSAERYARDQEYLSIIPVDCVKMTQCARDRATLRALRVNGVGPTLPPILLPESVLSLSVEVVIEAINIRRERVIPLEG